MSKALIFGGSGFIGSHVIGELLEGRYDVLNFDLVDYGLSHETKSYNHVQGSIMDYPRVSNIICEFKPDLVLNFVAISDIAECRKRPLDTLRKNVIGNQYILQGIADLIEIDSLVIPKFGLASSLYVYNDLSGPYGISKRECELWTRYYSKTYKFPHIIFRYGSVYGPGASGNNVIKKMVEGVVKRKKIICEGSADEFRRYVHVNDVARATVEIMSSEKYENQNVILAGPEFVKSSDVALMLAEILHQDCEVEFENVNRENHYNRTPYRRETNVTRRYDLGDCIDLDQGLLSVVEEVFSGRN